MQRHFRRLDVIEKFVHGWVKQPAMKTRLAFVIIAEPWTVIKEGYNSRPRIGNASRAGASGSANSRHRHVLRHSCFIFPERCRPSIIPTTPPRYSGDLSFFAG